MKELVFYRPHLSALLLSFLLGFLSIGNVYSGQDDSFHEDFLTQRMMIAKIREFRGEASAKALLTSLKGEAKKIGMKLPEWSRSGTSVGPPKYGLRLRQNFNSGRYDLLIQKASGAYDLPPALIKAIIRAESAFVKDAISHKGAQGLMQLMPETADEIGIQDAFDPRANILGGSSLIRKYLNEFGSLKKALIAYNAGPQWVRKRKGIPKETRTYIARVIGFYRFYKGEK